MPFKIFTLRYLFENRFIASIKTVYRKLFLFDDPEISQSAHHSIHAIYLWYLIFSLCLITFKFKDSITKEKQRFRSIYV